MTTTISNSNNSKQNNVFNIKKTENFIKNENELQKQQSSSLILSIKNDLSSKVSNQTTNVEPIGAEKLLNEKTILKHTINNSINNEDDNNENRTMSSIEQRTQRPLATLTSEFNSSESINTLTHTKTHRKQHSMSEDSFKQVQHLERNSSITSSNNRRAIKKAKVSCSI